MKISDPINDCEKDVRDKFYKSNSESWVRIPFFFFLLLFIFFKFISDEFLLNFKTFTFIVYTISTLYAIYSLSVLEKTVSVHLERILFGMIILYGLINITFLILDFQNIIAIETISEYTIIVTLTLEIFMLALLFMGILGSFIARKTTKELYNGSFESSKSKKEYILALSHYKCEGFYTAPDLSIKPAKDECETEVRDRFKNSGSYIIYLLPTFIIGIPIMVLSFTTNIPYANIINLSVYIIALIGCIVFIMVQKNMIQMGYEVYVLILIIHLLLLNIFTITLIILKMIGITYTEEVNEIIGNIYYFLVLFSMIFSFSYLVTGVLSISRVSKDLLNKKEFSSLSTKETYEYTVKEFCEL